jgi:hypothetical protein
LSIEASADPFAGPTCFIAVSSRFLAQLQKRELPTLITPLRLFFPNCHPVKRIAFHGRIEFPNLFQKLIGSNLLCTTVEWKAEKNWEKPSGWINHFSPFNVWIKNNSREGME